MPRHPGAGSPGDRLLRDVFRLQAVVWDGCVAVPFKKSTVYRWPASK